MALQEEKELKYIELDKLVPNYWNPQEMDEDEFNALCEQIEEVGFVDAITVVDLEDGTYRIIGGEHRWEGAKTVGLDRIPALVVPLEDWDEDEQKFITVRLNVLHGKMSPEKFSVLYEEMAEKYGKEPMQRLFAFTDQQAFEKLVGATKDGMKDALPPELQKEFEEAAKEAKTVEDLDRIIREMFNRYGDTVQSSFMVFTYGKQEHIYVAMTQKMRKEMARVLDYCKVAKKDINTVLAPIVKMWGDEADRKLKEEGLEGAEVVSDEAEDTVDF